MWLHSANDESCVSGEHNTTPRVWGGGETEKGEDG